MVTQIFFTLIRIFLLGYPLGNFDSDSDIHSDIFTPIRISNIGIRVPGFQFMFGHSDMHPDIAITPIFPDFARNLSSAEIFWRRGFSSMLNPKITELERSEHIIT